MILRLGGENHVPRRFMRLRQLIPSFHRCSTLKTPLTRGFTTSKAVSMSSDKSYPIPFKHHGDMHRINVMASNRRRRHAMLKDIVDGDLSAEDLSNIYRLFYSSLNVAPAELNGDKTFFLACDIWDSAFKTFNGFSKLSKLQQMLLTKRKLFVNSLLHFKYYEIYESIILPLLEHKDPIAVEWCDTLIKTIKFQYSNKHLTYDSEAITAFLKSRSNTIDEKRVLLSVFVRKGLFDNKSDDDIYNIIKDFMLFLLMTEDKHLLLTKYEHRQYKLAIFSIIEYLQKTDDPIGRIESMSRFVDNQAFFNIISTLIKVSSEKLPTATEKYFQYKLRNGLKYTISNDLTNMMIAFHSTRKFHEVFEISKNLPQFYDEDQLVILLKVSESLNDWKTLQSQFNEMYGQGHLPYVQHYSIVMKALASIGAKGEVDRLFSQLQKRKIKPSTSIYAALIQSRIVNNQFEEAKEIFNKYLSVKGSMKDSDLQISDLYRLITQVYLKKSDINEMLKFINETLERQEKENIELFDSHTLVQHISYFIECFSFKGIKYIHKTAEDLDLLNDNVYAKLVEAYTVLSQYSLAEDLLIEAHHSSLSPFRNPLLLKAQLRNYRIWFGHSKDHEIKNYIWNARNQLIDLVIADKTSNYSKVSLYSEMIRYFITRKMVAHAKNYIQRANVYRATEASYVPVLKYYSNGSNISHHEKVLALYKEMVSLNVDIGINTYEYLLKSVMYMDSSKDDFHNSDKLFESIINKYDINIPIFSKIVKDEGSEVDIKPIKVDLSDVAEVLCRIVSSYLIIRPGPQAEKADFFVKFLSELRERLDNQMKYGLRITIYKEMGKLYSSFHNLSVAQSLISNGLKELEQIIGEYRANYPLHYDETFEIINPKILENDYSTLMNLYLKLLQSNNSSPIEFLNVLNKCKDLGIQLRGNDLNLILEKLLQLDHEQGLEPMMFLIEEYLSIGTIHEQHFRDKMLVLYRAFIIEKCQVVPISSIEHQYRLFNQFYGIGDIKTLKESYSYTHKNNLKKLFNEFNKTYYKIGDYSYDYMMKNPEMFFSPEKRITTTYKIEPHLMSKVYQYIKEYCQDDPIKIFQLTDKYPSAIESSMFNGIFKYKLERFRQEINKVINPPTNTTETFVQRRSRTNRALKRLFGKDEFTDKDSGFFENDDFNEEG